jgi:hypothetical protein
MRLQSESDLESGCKAINALKIKLQRKKMQLESDCKAMNTFGKRLQSDEYIWKATAKR